ncbi:MAG: hypothetical protein WCJ50_08570, partial [Actinomycetes bacterium]
MADATHSEAPDQDQVDTLVDFFSPFADGEPELSEPCRAIAMNTGMALRFFHDLEKRPEAPTLSGLKALLLHRLGLPGGLDSAEGSPEWLERAVLVVNLDLRATAGSTDALFDEILRRLDPANPDGVLEGAKRCATCRVKDWCWPMANATALAASNGRHALNSAMYEIAVTRGRHIGPRTLWDIAAGLALGGLDVRVTEGTDPCLAIAQVAESGDEALLVQSLACNGALGPVPTEFASSSQAAGQDRSFLAAEEGALFEELARRDPSYLPTSSAHMLIADAGLDPVGDAAKLEAWLRGDGDDAPHPALARAATALIQGRAALEDGSRVWGRVLARAAWLGGELSVEDAVPEEFGQALAAQRAGASENDSGEHGRSLDRVLAIIEEGLAEVFGLRNRSDHYYPTSTPRPGAGADLLVQVSLIEDRWLKSVPDPVLKANRVGAQLV